MTVNSIVRVVSQEDGVTQASFPTFKEANEWLMQQGSGVQRECFIDDSGFIADDLGESK